MITTKFSDKTPNDNPHGVDARQIYNKDSAVVMHLTLQPGQALKPHITPVDVFFYVLEGTPTILVGEEELVVDKDTLVESPKDIVHCISNNADTVVRVMVVKAPKPTAKAKFV